VGLWNKVSLLENLITGESSTFPPLPLGRQLYEKIKPFIFGDFVREEEGE
jgi:hypothetical protein